MKIVNGTDIVEISRIQRDVEQIGERFLNKIYTKNEIEYCESKKNQKYQSYAARFAAKEALYKALSNKIDFEYSWKDFEILNEESGRPYVKLHFKIEDLESIEISLSHCKEYAVASVVAIYKEN